MLLGTRTGPRSLRVPLTVVGRWPSLAETMPAPSADVSSGTLDRWLVLSEASNSINRCMGLPDLYPFVISPVAEGKLVFVHELIAVKGGQAGE